MAVQEEDEDDAATLSEEARDGDDDETSSTASPALSTTRVLPCVAPSKHQPPLSATTATYTARARTEASLVRPSTA